MDVHTVLAIFLTVRTCTKTRIISEKVVRGTYIQRSIPVQFVNSGSESIIWLPSVTASDIERRKAAATTAHRWLLISLQALKHGEIVPIHQSKYPILGNFVPVVLMNRAYIRQKNRPHILETELLGSGV